LHHSLSLIGQRRDRACFSRIGFLADYGQRGIVT